MGKTIIRFGPVLGILLALTAPTRAVDDQKIKAAVQGALSFLRASSYANDSAYMEGTGALAGIAMIEAGLDPNDGTIQGIARMVRAAAITQTKTYQLALDIIFLDKLGEEVDTTLIQSMGVRLLAGQSKLGGWAYGCPGIDDAEQRRLKGALGGASMKGKKGDMVGVDPSKRPKLDPALEEIIKNKRFTFQNQMHVEPDDNSNTQFALLGLWAARRHGLPVEEALANLDRRLRDLQDKQTGGWKYHTTFNPTEIASPSMTCVGLLGLAVTSGSRNERSMKSGVIGADGTIKTQPNAPKKAANPLSDPVVQRGFAYLSAVLAGQNVGPRLGEIGAKDDLYTLWSLERVAVAYDLEKIGGVNWFQWGANYLVAIQQKDGSWKGRYPVPQVDTSFGLMFLCRANIVKDLSNAIKRMKAADNTTVNPSTDKPAGSGAAKPPTAPPAGGNDPTELAKALTTATGAKYAELLKQYTESTGNAFTEALLLAIPEMSGDAKKSVRDALAERMARLPKNLKQRLNDPNPEMRRACSLAVYMGEHHDLVPDVIELLGDADEFVVQGARLSLRSISEKDFGPAKGATAADKKKAIAEWKVWLSTKGGK